jgi:[acyl-carrier-protein] S-malonyltransferase
MVKNAVFLFPGQGSQYPGMALDFYDVSARVRELFVLASDVLGQDMKKLLSESDEQTLKRTEVAQPAVTLANLSSAAALGERGIAPTAVAGHSLGEYAALAVAGVVTEGDCFMLVKARGEAMREAAEKLGATGTAVAAGMAAVMGLTPEKIEECLGVWKLDGLFAANFNSPRQTVVSGTEAALAEAEKRFKDAGGRRFVRLPVSGPFHSPFMKAAADKFSTILQNVTFNAPKIPFFSNVTGKEVFDGAEAKKLALRQITSPVRWTDEEAEIQKLPLEAVLEVGPGAVLSGLWRDSGSTLECFPAGKLADWTKFA